jgi:CsoR family transcriptional regulator, copper-sensing transcriptional repressor
MTKYGYSDTKEQVLKRLNRAEGQVRGIGRMVNEDKYCIDILTQISAAQAALDKVALELLRDHTRHCLSNETVMPKGSGDKADELVGAINRLLSR